jgi:hypothetical protein
MCDACYEAFGDTRPLRKQLEATAAERDRYREALQEIASDLGTPGRPEWREAMEALGLDADAAERAWQD